MSKKIYLSILFTFLTVVPSMGQCWLREALINDKLESLIQFYGKEELLQALIEFNLSDTVNMNIPAYNDPLCKSGYFVWNSDNEYIPLSATVNGRGVDAVLSLKMKALYWMWLIFMDSNYVQETFQEKVALCDTTITDSNRLDYENADTIPNWPKAIFIPLRSPIVFDYINSRNHPDWLSCTFIKQHTQAIEEIEAVFREWGTAYRKKGLKYLQQRKISPLHNKYIFKRVHIGR